MDRRTALKTSVAVPFAISSALQYATGRAAATSGGTWSGPVTVPIVPIHVSLLPNSKVLFWQHGHEEVVDSTSPGGKYVRDNPRPYLWDLNAAPQLVDVPSMFGNIHTDEIYCSSMSLLPDGRLFVSGGHQAKWNTAPGGKNDEFTGSRQVHFYDPSASQPWSLGPDMAGGGRWYPSTLVLANGSVLLIDGIDHQDPTSLEFVHNPVPAIYEPGSNSFRLLSGASRSIDTYPWMYRVPNAPTKVFFAGPNANTGFLETSGTGGWVGPTIPSTFQPTRSPGAIHRATSVLYDQGKILNVGGIDVSSGYWEGNGPPTATAEVIDLNVATPAWRRVASMNFARQHLNATLLPDGKVLVTGGTSAAGNSTASGAVRAAEMWDPASNTWSVMASCAQPRMHHSFAFLLPDARVLVGGGGQTGFDNEVAYTSFEFFSPPYLASGGQRPAILAGTPSALRYGQTFDLVNNGVQISEAVLIRMPCVTHGVNLNQAFVRLNIKKVKNALQATLPNDATAAPPGHYMMFIVSNSGFPSIAKIVTVST